MALRRVVALGLLAVAGQAQELGKYNDCATGIHMIVARGTTEAPGEGKMGVVAGNVSQLIPGSTIAAVDYPASWLDYTVSVAAGAAIITEMIATYAAACPQTKIALLGYSQGGQASMDAVCGSSELGFEVSRVLSTSYKTSLIAAVTFGDPSHVADAPWNAGTSKNDGVFPRLNTSSCDPYADMIRGWCDEGDLYCDSGKVSSVHGGYFGNYTTAAADFIVEKYKEATGDNSTSSESLTTILTTSTVIARTTAAASTTSATRMAVSTSTSITTTFRPTSTASGNANSGVASLSTSTTAAWCGLAAAILATNWL